ncbi:hypothetical protein B7P43_G01837 [Cryptotermes secundus]|uniref:Transposase Tc1-like domain-containing protein n=1 Tax=Cryptotermes secundus TaxID=105785 RepID=A0A2J7QWB6_9NEOP|nr:hypothetical protein B7P43_G01837 [Cryptotermes secundus]
MLAYTNHGKTTSAKRSSGQKSTLTNATQVTAELNIHLEDPISTKTVQCELHKSSIHSRAAIAKPLIPGSNFHMHIRWCHNHKT